MITSLPTIKSYEMWNELRFEIHKHQLHAANDGVKRRIVVMVNLDCAEAITKALSTVGAFCCSPVSPPQVWMWYEQVPIYTVNDNCETPRWRVISLRIDPERQKHA